MTDAKDTKPCTRCGEVKALTQYSRKAKAKDGRRPICKSCDAAYYAANADAIKARQKRYREANPEVVKAAQKRWNEANPEAVKAMRKRWEQANADAIKARKKRYGEANAEKRKAYFKRRYETDREKIIARAKDFYRANAASVLDKAKARSEALAPTYVASLLGLPLAEIPVELLQAKREQINLRRLARQLRRASHESSEDIERITGEHRRSDDAGRPAADCGEQPVGVGPQGDQRHGRRGDGEGAGLDQQQPER